MIEFLINSGRSDTYRVNYISGNSLPKAKNRGGNKARNMSHRTASDVAQSNSRCCTEQQQVLHRAISDVAESDTNQSIKQKQSTKPPTKEENRPPAIQPTVFKQCGGEAEKDYAVDEEWERMFEDFWAAYPERCPRKVDRAKCRQRYANISAPPAERVT